MTDEDSPDVADRVAQYARAAGRRYAAARRAYSEGREAAAPASEGENRRLVCRRYAERRTVSVEDGRPDCFEAGHPDCEGCAADLRDGCVETW